MGKGRRSQPLVSCYECAGITHCLGSPQPGLHREEARTRASACTSWHKGRTTETVSVVGADRGMSRKKAEELVAKGRAEWVAPCTIRVNRPGAGGPGGSEAGDAGALGGGAGGVRPRGGG
ncbi:MAG: hypothetical protein K6T75_01195 [Acetobacteraceae bacterium]|nr:hypothetical protein [Acetobacteraceae bacterium]